MEKKFDRKKLISIIWVTGGELGMDSEDIHNIVYRETKKDSIRKCSDTELRRVITAFDFLANKRDASTGKITIKQKQFINDLAYRLGWRSDPSRLRGFLQKEYKVEHIDWLSLKQASDCIEALKNMVIAKKEKEAKENESASGNA